jgi:hypothetical protein
MLTYKSRLCPSMMQAVLDDGTPVTSVEPSIHSARPDTESQVVRAEAAKATAASVTRYLTLNGGEPIVLHPELTNKESSLTKPVSDIEDTSPLESAVARANTWEDLPKSALRAMFEAGNGRQRTRITHEQLAAIVGGTTDVLPFRTPFVKNGFATRSGVRLHDVMANGRFIEVKLGGDRVTPLELERDRFLISL